MNASTDRHTAPKIVGAVANAISILRLLAQSKDSAGVAAIARDTGISVSTCFNILRTLASERLVAFDSHAKTYRIGIGVLEFSVPLLGTGQADLILPELQRLSEKYKSLICLWQFTERERIVLADRVSTARTVRIDMPHGSRLPAYAGAVGRCYAALRDLPRAQLKKRFETVKWQAPPTFENYDKEVQRAKQLGFAFDFGRLFIGLEIAASIVSDATGKPRLGISGINIAGQLARPTMEQLAVDLRNSADWISETLFSVSRPVRESNRRVAAGCSTPRNRGRRP